MFLEAEEVVHEIDVVKQPLKPEDIAYENGTLKLSPNYAKQSDPFHIYHQASNKYIRPSSGQSSPADGTRLCVHSNLNTWTLWVWVPLNDYPGYGFIMHRDSKKFMQPEGGSPSPAEKTNIVLASNIHFSSVFTRGERS